ncbi:RDD family protein [Hymenobacter nivis]|uniref:RDD family protein n=1 Tax=Hymenobacter nivis TaxID=1850093 RepID=A0A502H272_9BACT|nr:RDD family protein [Hymenobacter nivis]TPG67466.1 RDD family protein [Hymenobacter nivis]
MSTLRIHTTQNVSLEYEVASVGERVLATLIDYALYLAWFALCGVLLYKLGAREDRVALTLMLLPTMFYFLVCEVFFNGQTLGKKARHLRVVRRDGTAPSLGDYCLRWLLRPFEVLFFFGAPALLTVLINGKGQRLGDLAAGTAVISLRPRAVPAGAPGPAPVPADYRPVFAQAAHLADHDAALLRQLVHQANARGDIALMHETANKVKALTGIATDLPDLPFLQTVLRDHAYLATQE